MKKRALTPEERWRLARLQRRNEARRLRCMSDTRFAAGRWFNLETEADEYWRAKQAVVLAARLCDL